MNDFIVPVKFLMWIVGVIAALGLMGQISTITYKAAEAAIEAHEKDQLSYGKVSRQLWSKPSKKKR